MRIRVLAPLLAATTLACAGASAARAPAAVAVMGSSTAVGAGASAGNGIHLNDAGHALVAARVLASDAWKATCKP